MTALLPADDPSTTAVPGSADAAVILASASPRRSELLRTIGIPFVVSPSNWQEPPPSSEDHLQPWIYVEHQAQSKAAACLATLNSQSPSDSEASAPVIVAADTVVWHEGRIYGQPQDAAHAVEMLRTLRSSEHQVLTGVCVKTRGACAIEHEVTRVRFSSFSDGVIERYVSTGEPMDKAGAYAAQGRGAIFIEYIEGDFYNVVGLPLARLVRMLERVAPSLEWWRQNGRGSQGV